MRTKNILLLTVSVILLVNCLAYADRPLDRAEVLQIFKQLTAQPKNTWIPTGTIEAIHEEYKAPKTISSEEIQKQVNKKIIEYQNSSNKPELTETMQKMKLDAIPFNIRHELSNEYTMSSNVIVTFDGERFYWEINVDSREDSVKPSKDLEGNFMTEQFNLDWNARRIFVWDGENYTKYYLPGNHAIVDSTGGDSHVANGPLTAGLIPWGYGYYSYDNLAALDSIAAEKYIDGQIQVHLSLNDPDGAQMLFVLDPAKDYAVISCVITGAKNAVISKQYFDYQLVSGNWVPKTILLERCKAGTNKLLLQDLWEITNIDSSTPSANSFRIDYKPDALIEYMSSITKKSVMCRYSESVDTDQLLADRLAFAKNEGTQQQNCATAALKYALSNLGKEVTDRQLAELVIETDGTANLWAMKQFTQDLGLYCRAVTTDIETLKGLKDCEIILHIPGKNHFVVLESIDESFVKIIDLSSNKFYYRTDVDFFPMDWTEGTAFIISNNFIEGRFAEIDDRRLVNITGASGYQCNKLRQKETYTTCTYVGGMCEGYYRYFYERWGCGVAESGSCSQSKMVRYEKYLCLDDPIEYCELKEPPTAYYMQACE